MALLDCLLLLDKNGSLTQNRRNYVLVSQNYLLSAVNQNGHWAVRWTLFTIFSKVGLSSGIGLFRSGSP